MRKTLLICALAVTAAAARAQAPKVQLPDEAAGVDQIVRALIAAFDQADLLTLGEPHGRTVDSDLRSIVVEFASTSEQSTLDRDIRGENVPQAQLEQVWKGTTQAATGVWDSPIADFFAAIRDVNSKLAADHRIGSSGVIQGAARVAA